MLPKIDRLIRSRRRSLALIIEHDASLTVRAPHHLSIQEIERFITNRKEWILQKQASLSNCPRPALRKFVDGEHFIYLGKTYPLIVVSESSKKLIFENGFQITSPALKTAPVLFEKWYRAQARSYISNRLDAFCLQHKLSYTKLLINSAKTRWGSCSSKNGLAFTWRLIMAPPDVVDYVILHELAHTVEHNHSAKFWSMLEKLLPNYKQKRMWLKQFGHHLSLETLPVDYITFPVQLLEND